MNKKKQNNENKSKYINKALNKIKAIHPWASKDNLRQNYTYEITEEDGKKVFISYFDNQEIRKCPLDDENKIIEDIVSDQEWWVEHQNPIKGVLKLYHCGTEDLGGWRLEQYEFRKHELGGYSSQVTAGNRSAGGSREFYLPPSFFKGTYQEFIQKYNDFVPGAFYLTKDILEKNKELKSFLGFKEE